MAEEALFVNCTHAGHADLQRQLSEAQMMWRAYRDLANFYANWQDLNVELHCKLREAQEERDAAIKRNKQLLQYSRNQEISLGTFAQKLYDMEKRAEAAEEKYGFALNACSILETRAEAAEALAEVRLSRGRLLYDALRRVSLLEVQV